MNKPDKTRRGVFLDRDGTINIEIGYIYDANDFKLYDFSSEAIARLNFLGLKTIVVTNQSGIARGYFTEKFVNEINRKMTLMLKKEGAIIDGIYYCPHLPEGKVEKYAFQCDCRKPKTGLFKKAASDFDLNLENSFVIGDKKTDIQPGKELNMMTILVLTGYGRETYRQIQNSKDPMPDYVVENLLEAVNCIEKQVKKA